LAKKNDLPALPFYPGDWFKALDVQLLPRDIRMTWFEMLLRMWESKRRGYLSINGEPPSMEELAQLLGFGSDVKLCEKHIEFLEKKEIFSRNKDGIIFNRRMVRDAKVSQKRSKAGKKGMKSRYKEVRNSYNKTANTSLTNTESESEVENEIITTKEGGVGETRKLFVVWSRNYENLGELQSAEKLINDYGFDRVKFAFHIAAEQGKAKCNIGYVRGILKNHTHQSLEEWKKDESDNRGKTNRTEGTRGSVDADKYRQELNTIKSPGSRMASD
jgi:hypothetical protein